MEIKYSDPDSEFLSASQRLSCVAGDITPELLRNFFCLRGDKLVEWRYRRFFCPAVAGAECNTVIELKPEHHAALPWSF
ncbi:hypothetical protein, partial [Pseudomonas marincola]|uniref:hypothetical protein n=1 Tax=Pseudomonas marincola TaxID=437900 RepID=UPI003001539B